MKLRSLTTTNYCQHEGEHRWDFTGSVIGIVGPNGSGKSNLIKAIEFAVTGGLERKRNRIVSFGHKKGSVTLELEIRPGLFVTIHRELHRENAELKFSDGREAVLGTTNVNKALLELLETDKTLLEQIVFVNQDSIAALLFAPASEKDRLASRFFGLERAVAIERLLSEEIASIQLTPLAVPLAEQEEKVDQLSGESIDLNAALDRARHHLGDRPTEWTARREALNAFWGQREAREAANLVRAARAALNARLEPLVARRDTLSASIASIPVERVRGFYIRESERRRKSELRRAVLADQARLEAEGQALTLRADELTRLSARLPELDDSIAAAERVGHRDEHLVELQKGILAGFDDIGKAECPVCHTELQLVGDYSHKWEDAQIEGPIRADVEREITENESVRQLPAWRRERAELMRQLQAHELRVETFEGNRQIVGQRLDALGPDEGPGEPEAWERALAQYDDLRQELARVEYEVGKLQEDLSDRPELQPDDSSGSVPEGFDPVAEQAWLEETNRLHHEVQRQQDRLETLEFGLAQTQRSLEAARTTDAENKRLEARRQTLLNLRRTFHPDGAPAELVQRRIERLEEGINGFLEALAMPFRCKASDGFNFQYVFDDDTDNPRTAAELSGGQRVAMSIAFRLAALNSFSASVGLLVLDEPSAAMDAERVELFAELLRNLEAMAERCGLTFLFVTHSEPLISSFNQLIDLTPTTNFNE